MKIALFAFHFAEYAYRLACSLAEQNKVLLFMHEDNACQELGRSIVNDSKEGLEIVLQPKRGPKNPLFFLNVKEIITSLRRFRPDVIHYQESLNYSFTVARFFYSSCSLVLTVHDHIPHTGAHIGRTATLHKKYLRKIVDAAIVHGEKIRMESELLMPWLDGRIFSIPHGPLGERTLPVNHEWEEGKLLFFGRIEKYKGLGCLVEAVRLLKKQGISVKVVIAGRGNDLEPYRQEISGDSSYELLERYISAADVQRLYESANAVVLPYTDATQSGVAAMALQFGRPMIASDVGSIGEMVRDGVNGLLVPPRDPKALSEAIKKLITDQSLARHFSNNAARLASGELSWSEIARRSIDVYRFANHNKRTTWLTGEIQERQEL